MGADGKRKERKEIGLGVVVLDLKGLGLNKAMVLSLNGEVKVSCTRSEMKLGNLG